MTQFLQYTVSATSLTCVIALVATGWVVIYQVSGVLNLAQGNFVVLGGLIFVWLSAEAGLALPLAVLGTLACVAATGILADLVALRPAKSKTGMAPIFITLGLAEILTELGRMAWGPDPVTHTPFFSTTPIVLAGAAVQRQALLLWGVTALVFIGLWLLFERTLLGKAFRACADSPSGASLVGINPSATRTWAFALAAALGAVAGILLAPLTPIAWSDGLAFALKGFAAAMLGMWSYRGAVLGSAILAAAETYTAGYASSAWKDVVSLSFLIIALVVLAVAWEGRRRPGGRAGAPWRRPAALDGPPLPAKINTTTSARDTS